MYWRRLPEPAYDEADVDAKTEALFKHVFYAYPMVPSPIFISGVG